ncbi:MAG TPA: hypothetical protein VIO36_07370 [Anaerolineaceae bacterium]
MRTPAGFDCPFFYGNYFRGRKQEECRLASPETAHNWTPDHCKTCPVPGIIRANACPNLVLHGSAEKNLFGLVKRMKVSAFCKLSNENVKEPHIGCGKCHPLPDVFKDVP